MSIMPRRPGDPLNAEDIIFIISMIAMILIFVFIIFPTIQAMLTPNPDEIVKFFANGTALLGNGTLINTANLTMILTK